MFEFKMQYGHFFTITVCIIYLFKGQCSQLSCLNEPLPTTPFCYEKIEACILTCICSSTGVNLSFSLAIIVQYGSRRTKERDEIDARNLVFPRRTMLSMSAISAHIVILREEPQVAI